MKKIIISIVIAIISVFELNAQNLIIDRQVNDSVRHIETSVFIARSFTDRVVWCYALIADEYKDSLVYTLAIKLNAMNPISIKNKGVGLIKTFNNDVIKLYMFNTGEVSTILGYKAYHNIFGTTVKKNEVVGNIAYFYISKDDIKKLMISGISKIRIECNNNAGYMEKEYSKDKVSGNFRLAFNNINACVKQKHNTIEDNF